MPVSHQSCYNTHLKPWLGSPDSNVGKNNLSLTRILCLLMCDSIHKKHSGNAKNSTPLNHAIQGYQPSPHTPLPHLPATMGYTTCVPSHTATPGITTSWVIPQPSFYHFTIIHKDRGSKACFYRQALRIFQYFCSTCVFINHLTCVNCGIIFIRFLSFAVSLMFLTLVLLTPFSPISFVAFIL